MDRAKAKSLLDGGAKYADAAGTLGVTRARLYQLFPKNQDRTNSAAARVREKLKAEPNAYVGDVAKELNIDLDRVRRVLERVRPVTGKGMPRAQIMLLNGANVNYVSGKTKVPVTTLLEWFEKQVGQAKKSA